MGPAQEQEVELGITDRLGTSGEVETMRSRSNDPRGQFRSTLPQLLVKLTQAPKVGLRIRGDVTKRESQHPMEGPGASH